MVVLIEALELIVEAVKAFAGSVVQVRVTYASERSGQMGHVK